MKKHDGFCGVCGKPCPAVFGTCYGCHLAETRCVVCGKPRSPRATWYRVCPACDDDCPEPERPFVVAVAGP